MDKISSGFLLSSKPSFGYVYDFHGDFEKHNESVYIFSDVCLYITDTEKKRFLWPFVVNHSCLYIVVPRHGKEGIICSLGLLIL